MKTPKTALVFGVTSGLAYIFDPQKHRNYRNYVTKIQTSFVNTQHTQCGENQEGFFPQSAGNYTRFSSKYRNILSVPMKQRHLDYKISYSLS